MTRRLGAILWACWLALGSAVAQQPANREAATDDGDRRGEAANGYTYRQKGMRAMEDGIYSAAARFFGDYREAVADSEPEFADATILLVRALLKQKHTEHAREALNYHSEHSPGLEDPYYREALTYWKAAVHLAARRWQDAVAVAKPLAEKASTVENRHRALALLGDAYVKMKQWRKAQEVLTRLIREVPGGAGESRARMGLVRTYLANDRPELAMELLDAVQKHPRGIPLRTIHAYRVLADLDMGRLDRAYDRYRDIEASRPQHPDEDWWTVSSQLAAELIRQGRCEDALVVLPHARSVATDREDRVQTDLRIIECLLAEEKKELAINALNEFKKNYSDADQVMAVQYQLAELLRETDNVLSAAEYFAEIAASESASPEMRYRASVSRGWCFNQAEQYDNAVEAFVSAVDLARSDKQATEALVMAGDAAFQMQNYTKAAIFYQRVADNYGEAPLAEKARYQQAVSRATAKLYANAALVYQQFLEAFPQSDRVPLARLERGVALRNAGDYAKAVDEFDKFTDQYPHNQEVPRALMEAHAAALGANDVPTAIRFLTRLIQEYPDSQFFPQALYKRAYANFYASRNEAALRDCERFLEDYPLLPMAADVFIWVGDYYANEGQLKKSEKYFLQLVTTQAHSRHAPMALYEAAKSAYRRGDNEKAALLLEQLQRDYPEMPKRIAAQAHMLAGDIAAKRGRFEQAIPAFRKVQEALPGTPLALAARGRQGEMHYSAGVDDPDSLQSALEVFSSLLEEPGLPAELRQKALYRRAKTFEKLGRGEAAIKDYLDIVYQYDLDVKADRIKDWYYFVRAGYDAGNLLVGEERFREAARTYERLARAGIPTGKDAAQRAREIRDTHGLGE